MHLNDARERECSNGFLRKYDPKDLTQRLLQEISLRELSKESFKPDSDGERRICCSLLKLVNDQSSDVQSLAVKCLSPLVRKVHEERMDEIMSTLVTHVLTGTDEQRDICSIGSHAFVHVGARAPILPRHAVSPPLTAFT